MLRRCLFLLVLFAHLAESKTICLNMIVKNESQVIERCLTSVKPLIDSWVIVDTGSTDGTQKIIRALLKEIPGELYERPWVNFAHNRNEALALAKGKGDYLLFMDADEELFFPKGFLKPALDKEAYLFPYQNAARTYTYYRIALVSNHLPWQWQGEMHESLESLLARPKTHEYFKDIVNVTANDGKRSQDPKKTLKDAQILEEMLKKDPNNARYVFYLAQSYRDAQEYELAIQNFAKRATMGGCAQEVFWSLYQLGGLQEFLKKDAQGIIDVYCKAYQVRPSRVEPLYRLACLHKREGNIILAYLTAKEGLSIPLPNDMMYVENWIYEYGLLLEFAHTAYLLGHHNEARDACLKILAKENVPLDVKQRVQQNLSLCLNISS